MQNSSTNHIVSGLNHAFRQELEKMPNYRMNLSGSPVHKMQVDFTYAIDAITRGSSPEIEAGISTAKKLIAEMRKANNS